MSIEEVKERKRKRAELKKMDKLKNASIFDGFRSKDEAFKEAQCHFYSLWGAFKTMYQAEELGSQRETKSKKRKLNN